LFCFGSILHRICLLISYQQIILTKLQETNSEQTNEQTTRSLPPLLATGLLQACCTSASCSLSRTPSAPRKTPRTHTSERARERNRHARKHTHTHTCSHMHTRRWTHDGLFLFIINARAELLAVRFGRHLAVYSKHIAVTASVMFIIGAHTAVTQPITATRTKPLHSHILSQYAPGS
jgi:hypothetical protein